MYEQDYIMRLIHEMVRMMLKLVFHIDTENPAEELLEENEEQEMLYRLLNLADRGDINRAENELCELLLQGGVENLKTALLFYSYLNDKEDEFLEEHDFSREEIKLGLEDVISQYGLESIADVFLLEV